MSASPADFALASSTGLVAVSLLVSGTAKLGASDRTMSAMRGLRVPRFLQRRWIAGLLPVWELLLSATVVFAPGPFRASAAWLTVATFAVFTVALAAALRRRDDVDCGCFGPLSISGRVTGWSIVRNGALIMLALIVAVFAWPHGTLVHDLIAADLSFVLGVGLTWAITAIVVLGALLWSARREIPEATGASAPSASSADTSPATVSMGDPVPDLEVVSADGIPVTLDRLGRGMPVLIVFAAAACSSCVRVAKHIPQWQAELAPVRIRVLTSSRRDQVEDRFPQAATYTRYGAKAAMLAFGVTGSPAAVMLGGREYPVVASPVVYGLEGVEALVQSVTAARQHG